MDAMKTIFSACYSIMQLPIPLFGFQLTLWNIFIFSAVAYCVVRLVFGIFK